MKLTHMAGEGDCQLSRPEFRSDEFRMYRFKAGSWDGA